MHASSKVHAEVHAPSEVHAALHAPRNILKENFLKKIPLPGLEPRPLATVRVDLSDALDHSATVTHIMEKVDSLAGRSH